MERYHKINSLFKRNMGSRKKSLIMGDYTLPEFEYLKDCQWLWTEKVDGTNIRVQKEIGNPVNFERRNANSQIPLHLLSALNDMFCPNKLSIFDKSFSESSLCLYGEGYGPKIQKGGGDYRSDPSFVVFDVMIGDLWLSRANVENVTKGLGIEAVPIIDTGTIDEGIELIKNGLKSTWGDFFAEGIVLTPMVPLYQRSGKRIITKIKHCDYYNK